MSHAIFTGTVVGRPDVRSLPTGQDGQVVPVLCLELLSDSGACTVPVRVQQPFPAGAWAQCRAAARRLQPGQHITVHAPIKALRLLINGAAHIQSKKPKDHHG